MLQEGGELALVDVGGRHEAPDGIPGPLAERLDAELGARGADDPAGPRDLAVPEAVIEGGKQLAGRQVSGCAEDDAIE